MIDIILVTDKEITALNKEWFHKNRPTDVIAFNYDNKKCGEIYISVDTGKRQARERGVRLKDELLRLAVHGTAHIEGYDDGDLANFTKMREREWEMLVKCLSA